MILISQDQGISSQINRNILNEFSVIAKSKHHHNLRSNHYNKNNSKSTKLKSPSKNKKPQRNENGLTTNHGLINGNGLTDGNGLTINLISNNKPVNIPRQTHRLKYLTIKHQRKKLLQAVIAVFLIMLPLSIYLIEFAKDQTNIQIDGEFRDWDEIKTTKYIDTDLDPILNPSTNIVECRLNHEANILDFYIRTEWDIFGGKRSQTWTNNEIYKLNVFIDSDLDSTTGYQIDCLGAEERIELQGQNGVIMRSFSYSFDNNKNNFDWNGWTQSSNVDVASERFRLEGKHYLSNAQSTARSSLNTQSPQRQNTLWPSPDTTNQLGVIIQLMDSTGSCDLTAPLITGSDTWQQLKIIDLSPDNLISDGSTSTVPLVALEFSPNIIDQDSSSNTDYNSPCKLESLGWRLDFPNSKGTIKPNLIEDFGEFDLFVDENSNHKLDHSDDQLRNYKITETADGQLTITFSPALSIDFDSKNCLLLTFTPYYNALVPELLRIVLEPTQVQATSTIVIEIPENTNNQMLMYLGEAPTEITVDGIFSDWCSDELVYDVDIPILPLSEKDRDFQEVNIDINPESNVLSCYLNVQGCLLKGTDVPPIFYSDVLTSASDQDPVDSSQNSASDKLYSIDDSRIIADLPHELLGTDKISIFIDADRDLATGFKDNWLPLGAEYLIEISGRDGQIDQQQLLEYDPAQGQGWSWTELGIIPANKDAKQLETQLDWSSMDLKSVRDFDIAFYISDWTDGMIDKNVQSSSILRENFVDNPITFTSQENIDNGAREPETATRGSIINSTETGVITNEYSNQRKIVRDINDYWYVIWVDSGGIIRAKRSDDTTGVTWSSAEIVLAGNSSCVINGATNPSFEPSIDIFLDADISNNELHLVWAMEAGTQNILCYSKCTNITNYDNFSNPSRWSKANNLSGYDIIDNNIDNALIQDNYGMASIAVDRYNRPHVVWQYEYQNFDYMINYTRYDFTNGWHNGNGASIQISLNPTGDHRSPSIDIGHNDTIHVAYINYTGVYQIQYRQSWDPTNSMNINYWGNAARTTNQEDIALGGLSFDANEPSLVCDAQGNVWIATYETISCDIWQTMEDFNDASYWPGPFLITSQGENKFPTLGYDESGTVYCVWQHKITTNNYGINISYNTSASNSWSASLEIANGKENIYPHIPVNITGMDSIVGIMYKNETEDFLMFASIPELSDYVQLLFLILMIQALALANGRGKKREFWKFWYDKWRKD